MTSQHFEYIEDLRHRMNSNEKLPQSGPFESSKDTVMWHAHDEARALTDIALLPAISEHIETVRTPQDIQSLAFILRSLIKNTRSSRGIELYKALWSKASTDDQTLMYLIDGAKVARIAECKEEVVRSLDVPGRLHFSSAVQYLGAVVGSEAVPLLGEILDHDCYGRYEPIVAILALQETGDKAALPYLQRCLERHRDGKEDWRRDTVHWCVEAIHELTTS